MKESQHFPSPRLTSAVPHPGTDLFMGSIKKLTAQQMAGLSCDFWPLGLHKEGHLAQGWSS